MSDLVPGDDKKDKDDRYFHYMDDKGELHLVDMVTGDIVKSAPRFEDGLVPGKQFAPQFVKGNTTFWNYSAVYRDLICQRVAEGMSLTKIAKQPGFPSTSIMAKWRQANPDFEDMYQAARQARAEAYADQIADSLDDMDDMKKDEVPAQKLKYDKLKWLAEKNDPKTYGTKDKGGEGNAPITMVINTGVPLEDEDSPVTIEVNNEQS